MASGNFSFGEIKRLDDQWWKSAPPNDPSDVWKTWDRNTRYLWGANSQNYQGIPIGHSLNGAGMAGPHGPTRGMAHPNYVGVITMNLGDMGKNDPVFQDLGNWIGTGKDVVIPTLGGKFSLGTGVGTGIANWGSIQEYLLNQIYILGQSAGSVNIPSGTYWPDCRQPTPYPEYPIAKLDDLISIVKNVLSGI